MLQEIVFFGNSKWFWATYAWSSIKGHLCWTYLPIKLNSVKNKGEKKFKCNYFSSVFLTFWGKLRPYFLTDLDGNCIILFRNSFVRSCPCYFFQFLSTFLIKRENVTEIVIFSFFEKCKILKICKIYAKSKLKKVRRTWPGECLSEQNDTSPIKIGKKLRPELAPENPPFSTQNFLAFFSFFAI